MDILEGNKLLADFLGYEYTPFNNPHGLNPGWWKKGALIHSNKIAKLYLGRSHNDLKFHSSYERLMSVVEFIERLDYPYTQYSSSLCVTIYENNCEIEYSGYEAGILVSESGTTKKEAIWKACVNFVKLYNTWI